MTLVCAQHGHEVRVAVPAGDDVPVQVPRQPRPGRSAQVQADVVAVGPEQPVEHARSAAGSSRSARSGPAPPARPASPRWTSGATRRWPLLYGYRFKKTADAGRRQASRFARSSSPARPRQRKQAGSPGRAGPSAPARCIWPRQGAQIWSIAAGRTRARQSSPVGRRVETIRTGRADRADGGRRADRRSGVGRAGTSYNRGRGRLADRHGPGIARDGCRDQESSAARQTG